MSQTKHKIIDGDGHVVEDHSAIAGRMSEIYRDRFGSSRSPYPPNDHLHSANAHALRRAMAELGGGLAWSGRESSGARMLGSRLFHEVLYSQ